MEHQKEFVEHFQYGKQFGKILAIRNWQKRHRAPTHILLGLKSEKYVIENQVPNSEKCAEWIRRFSKRAHEVPN